MEHRCICRGRPPMAVRRRIDSGVASAGRHPYSPRKTSFHMKGLAMETSSESYPRGKALAAAAERVIPGGVNSTTRYIGTPYAFGSGTGAYLTDLDGHRYLDYHAAFGAMLLGHNFDVVDEAVREVIGG